MNRKEFSQALKIADQHIEMSQNESDQAAIATFGCAYDKKVCALNQVAWLINYQTMQMNGTRDSEALSDLYGCACNLILI